MRSIHHRLAVIASLALAATMSAFAADPELQALRAQITALEQQLKSLSRQLELKEQAPAASARPLPSLPLAGSPASAAGTLNGAPANGAPAKVTINDKGYTFGSADAANVIRLRGLLQTDARQFFDDDGGIANTAFVMRRIRIITEGTLAKNFSYQFVPEFGGSTVTINEANLAVAFTESLAVRFGRFKEPIGLERLQSDSWTFFVERSIATNLTPDRDVGVQAFGTVGDGRVEYALGVFNGIADAAGSTNTDFDDDKDIAGRVFIAPFKHADGSPLQGLSFGIGGSIGRQKTALGHTGGYRTDGQQVFFAYNPGVVADGRIWRIAPQLDYRAGSFGLQGEYIISTVNLRPAPGRAKTEVRNASGQLALGYVLTGEPSSYNGVVPRVDFDLAAGTWGAFEVAARHAFVRIDDMAFPIVASPFTNASDVRALGLGLNWYLSKAVVFKFDCFHNRFGFHGLAPAVSEAPVLRADEKVFTTRFQLSF